MKAARPRRSLVADYGDELLSDSQKEKQRKF